jgi:hypothetical protein
MSHPWEVDPPGSHQSVKEKYNCIMLENIISYFIIIEHFTTQFILMKLNVHKRSEKIGVERYRIDTD